MTTTPSRPAPRRIPLSGRLRLRWQRRIRPLAAWRAMRAVLADPDDTARVFVVIRALSGGSFERLLRRVRRDPQGARIVAEQRDLLPLLCDRGRLLALPEDTLGHQYARFVEREQISADGLVAASESEATSAVPAELVDPEAIAFGARLRDMHDLWHVVTGYGRDILGELALLAFTYEQTRNRGIGFIVRTAERRIRRGGGNDPVARFVAQARARGRAAALLPAADWEALLERPLDEVRRTLRVGEPVAYQAHRSAAGEAALAASA